MRLPRLLPLAVTVAIAPAATAARGVAIHRSHAAVRLATRAAIADVHLDLYRLDLRERRTMGLLVREQTPSGLFYERDGATHTVGSVSDVTTLTDGVRLTVATDEGSPATVTVRFITPRTLEVVFDPPTPAGVAAMGDRLRSPPSERLYGLTERLRDSPALAPGTVDIPVDDLAPPEVGSLDRRGGPVERRVLPPLSIYAPFFQSSRGYGLAVAGTTFGLFDLAKSDARTVSFRFETGTTADSQRLVFHLFVGPEYTTILDEYTSLVGR